MMTDTIYCPDCGCHVTPVRDGGGACYCPRCEELLPGETWSDEPAARRSFSRPLLAESDPIKFYIAPEARYAGALLRL